MSSPRLLGEAAAVIGLKYLSCDAPEIWLSLRSRASRPQSTITLSKPAEPTQDDKEAAKCDWRPLMAGARCCSRKRRLPVGELDEAAAAPAHVVKGTQRILAIIVLSKNALHHNGSELRI